MKENQRIALTKRLLKEGLLRLMEHKPLDKISVSELCSESGINRATFYRHYDMPRDVLDDIERDLIGGIGIETWKINTLQDISKYSESTFQYMYDHADMLKILLKNRSDEEFTRFINQMCEEIFCYMKIISDLDKDNIKLISAYSMGGVYFLLRQWLLGDIQKQPREISQLIMWMLNIIDSEDA